MRDPLFKFEKKPENFHVEEVPLLPFDSVRNHAILKVEKVGESTLELVERLSSLLNVPQREIGYAGLKDAQAKAVQYISIPYSAFERLKNKDPEGINILQVFFNSEKLRTGRLKGNRFRVVLEEVRDSEGLRKKLEEITEKGFPNFYDTQRFGAKGENLKKGLKMLKGLYMKASFYKRRLYISAVASWFFNLYLEERIKAGYLHRTMKGDLLIDEEGRWVPERYSHQEENLIPTGPILGYRMPLPEKEALDFERQLLEREGLNLSMFRPFRAPGSRRAIKVYPKEVKINIFSGKAVLEFFLPKGSYATVMIKELACPPSS